mmetsp:Transcript_2776/g.12512  ORF Transcript_2776/g.12512 Transcript_2776/m.12512 type:complete len:414 (-) Transcript_2776:3235-4476(-)
MGFCHSGLNVLIRRIARGPASVSCCSTTADRVAELESEGAYAVMAAASKVEQETGKKVARLEIGQPTFPTPQHIVQAGVRAIESGQTKYSSPSGVQSLKEAVAEHTTKTRGIKTRPEEVVIGPGAKPGLFLTTLALVNAGDEVMYPDPGFPTYKAMTLTAGATPVPVPLTRDGSSFEMASFEKLISPKTKLVVLNSPGNPTGGVMPQNDLERIAELAKQYDFWVMTDEIYSRLLYDIPRAPSIYSIPGMKERTILVDGFSKTYCMTGWRLGWAVMPQQLTNKVELLLTHSVGCTATFTQGAGVAALTGPEDDLLEMIEDYRSRRDLVVQGLNSIPGVTCPVPAGAFYAFFDVSSFGLTSREISTKLLQEGLVAVLPGTDFGANGEGFLRLSYASPRDQIEQGLERILSTLKTL